MTDRLTVAPLGSSPTPAELRVLRAWWDCRDERDITGCVAERTGLSANTVRNHVSNARSRLGVRKTLLACLAVIGDRAA